MSVLDLLLTIVIAIIVIWLSIAIYMWLITMPINRELKKSANKQFCPEHGQFLHVCVKCKR